MSDLSTPPLSLAPLEAAAPWRWPTPPFAGYPVGEGLDNPACEIEGLTSAAIAADLLALDFDAGCVRVRIHITGTEMTLRFAQLRRITLTTVLASQAPAASDPHAQLLAHHPVSDYRLRLVGGGGWLSGRSIGHVASAHGVFLFPPADERGSVQRMFVPASTYGEFEIGPRIGQVLVEQNAATAEQIDAAVAEQAALRTRKLGELLLVERIVGADQLLAAIDQQARMPVVRIGEALVALNLISPAQLASALEQQKSDRSIPLGELLVNGGHVSREHLQLALARKMGYPVVDAAAFPVEAEAVRRLPFSVARRMAVLPLLLRGTQLVVAMADPARRAEIDELEFITQLKLVPTLAPIGTLPSAVAATYQRFGADSWAANTPLQAEALIEYEAADAGKLLESLEQQQAQSERDDDPQAFFAATSPPVVANPAALTYRVEFSTTAGVTTVSVLKDGAATAVAGAAYVSGRAIEIDGMAFNVSGAPAAGDAFELTLATPTLGVFDTFDRVIAELKTPLRTGAAVTQGVQRGLADLDGSMGALLSLRGRVGELLNRTDSIEGRIAAQALAAQTERSNAEDLDMVQAISDFRNQQTGYDAALKTYATVQRMSLFQYLNGG